MKFDYPFEREDYVRFLKMMNKKSNFACMFLFTIVYFIAIFDLLKDNILLVCVFYIVSISILYCVLKMISILFASIMAKRNDKLLEYAYGTYHISIDKKAIKEEIGDKKFEIKFGDVSHVSTSRNYFIVYPKNSGIMYIFMKSSFKTEEKYQECKNMIFSYVEEAKKEENVVEEKIENQKKDDVKKEEKKEPKKKTSSGKKKQVRKENTAKRQGTKKKTK